MSVNKQPRPYRFETLALHAGQAPDPASGARAVPIYQTVAYLFQDTQHAAELYNLDEAGMIYTRIGNPTTDVFEKRMAWLEGGVAAVAFATGHAALHAVIGTLCRAGDHIVSASTLYGGSVTLFDVTMPRLGVTTTLVDPSDPENFRKAIRPNTRFIHGETIGNPRLNVLDIEAVARVAHEAGLPLVIDNTFASPYLCRPIEWGADIVYHSATKYIGGHGTTMGGVVIDSGRFDWGQGKHPNMVDPDAAYHGMSWWNDWGTLAFSTRLRTCILRDWGATISPFNAWMLLQGLETLPLRMRQHSENGLAVAKYLAAHPAAAWVAYPGLKDHPTHALAKKYLKGGFGGMVVFGVTGGRDAGMRFIESLALWSHLANVGDAKSLAIHPATTTHQQLTKEQLEAAGVGEDLIRLSVGLEHHEDLVADLENALASASARQRGETLVNDEATIRWLLKNHLVAEQVNGHTTTRPKVIAVVGLSDKPGRPSYRTSRKMQRLGYKIVPVNPRIASALGEPSFPDLKSIPFKVDCVQVFREAKVAAQVAHEAAAIRPRIFWPQEGVVNEEAAAIAAQAGIDVVMNRCTFKEAQRLRGPAATWAQQSS